MPKTLNDTEKELSICIDEITTRWIRKGKIPTDQFEYRNLLTDYEKDFRRMLNGFSIQRRLKAMEIKW